MAASTRLWSLEAYLFWMLDSEFWVPAKKAEVVFFPAQRSFDSDETGWIQLLVIVVIAVFYAIGSLLKARGQTEEDRDEGPPRRPAADASARAVQALKQLRRGEPWRQRRIERKVSETAHRKPVFEPPLPVSGKPLEPVFTGLGKIELGMTPPAAEDLVAEPFVDVEDVEQLQKAVIYREIIDKPLALREF
jgi:hypothetical protein